MRQDRAHTSPEALRAWLLGAALLASLVLLLLHARAYWFLTDDAFISFRYARNLSHGHGLVFNPGFERVEGYSNFLWVLILAGLDRLGWAPERAANVLSGALTVVLFGLVALYTLRRHAAAVVCALAPATWLALTRSFAVWSSSGLETRLYELLVVAGVLRLLTEIERRRADGPAPAPIASALLGLATLTRPDGLLVAGSALGAAGLVVAAGRLDRLRGYALSLVPFVLIVGAHFAFRLAYYGAWLPNTYYAKLAGRLDPASGLRYLAAFAIEYMAFLWLPLLALGAFWRLRRGEVHVSIVLAAALVPYIAYIVAIGGDHFEYRPLDLLFPFVFLLMADGLRALGSGRVARVAAVSCFALVAVGLVVRPWQTHVQFPPRYYPGYPGSPELSEFQVQGFLAPERDGPFRLPGLRVLAAAHRRLLFKLTYDYACIRAEEHRMFADIVTDEGLRLRGLIERGALPRDVHLALSCVGAMPYYSDARTLDRHGLTDAHVARSPFVPNPPMAHGKFTSWDYARERGVDVWSVDRAYPLCHATSANALTIVRRTAVNHEDYYAADVGDGWYLMAAFPQGLERAQARMPALRFQRIDSPDFEREFVERSIPLYLDSLRVHRDDVEALARLALLARAGARWDVARAAYETLAQTTSPTPELLEQLADCYEGLGDFARSAQTLDQAARLAAASAGDPARVARLEARRERARRLAAGAG